MEKVKCKERKMSDSKVILSKNQERIFVNLAIVNYNLLRKIAPHSKTILILIQYIVSN